jgi:hypothetical protein
MWEVERRILLAFLRMMRMCLCGGEGGRGVGGGGEDGFVVVGRGEVS